MTKKRIYLDHGATTPLHAQVAAAMRPYWDEQYGNPSSVHLFGQEAGRAVEQARETVADLLQAKPSEIIFTGCGSESDNLAVRGAMLAARAAGCGNHLIVSAIEHEAVLRTAEQLRDLFGFELTVLPVNHHGRIDLNQLRQAIRPDTALISIMAANNEIGSLQPVAEIGAIAREQGVLFHTDAIQAATTQTWDMTTQPIDLLSLSPHKFYGPKGIGILYVRDGVELTPMLTGGSQEHGLRAGTSNVPLIVGAAQALQLVYDEADERLANYTALRDRLISGVLTAVPQSCRLTGHPVERLPHHASFAFGHISGNEILMHLDMAGIAASSGSACKSGDPKPSAVLSAIGLSSEWTKGGLRLTVGTQNTVADIDYAVETLAGVVERLRKMQAMFA